MLYIVSFRTVKDIERDLSQKRRKEGRREGKGRRVLDGCNLPCEPRNKAWVPGEGSKSS